MSFVILALIGCAQGMPAQGQAPYTPNLPGSDANMHEHGGGDGGGGGGSMVAGREYPRHRAMEEEPL